MLKRANNIIFFGALWGLTEATLGYFLHITTINIGWALWMPIAVFFLSSAYKSSGKISTVICVSIIAAGIKMIDLLIPGRIDRVLNPTASILLEGMVMSAYYFIIQKNNIFEKFKYLGILLISISWRILYLVYMLFMPKWMIEISPLASTYSLFMFILYESLTNSVIIYFVMKLIDDKFKNKLLNIGQKISFSSIISISLLVFTMIVQLYI